MRYLKLIILFLAYAMISPAFADVCCPSGCVPSYALQFDRVCLHGYPEFLRLWLYLPREFWRLVRRLRLGTDLVSPRQVPTQCIPLNPTKAMVDAGTNKCVNDLTGNAQFWGCLFEDDAGRAEDQRTGLSCAERQAALAKRCLKRCAAYASYSTHTFCVGVIQTTSCIFSLEISRVSSLVPRESTSAGLG
jgi:hypothetical protein